MNLSFKLRALSRLLQIDHIVALPENACKVSHSHMLYFPTTSHLAMTGITRAGIVIPTCVRHPPTLCTRSAIYYITKILRIESFHSSIKLTKQIRT